MPSVRRSGKSSGVFHRGSEGRKLVEQEVAKAKERAENRGKGFGPMRFFLRPGEEKEFVVLDEEPDFFLYEHTLMDPQTKKFTERCVCIGQYATCPVCESGNYAAYIMVLSVLDLTPYTKKDGTVEEFSRKLLVVKPSQQKFFMRKFEREGSLRGAVFLTARDKKTDAAIGNDIELIEFMDLDELENDYIRTWKDNEDKTHEENCGEPFVYEEIFTEPTEDELHALVGTTADDVPGTRRQSRAALDDKYEEEEEKPSRGRSRRSRRKEEDDDAPKERTRSRRWRSEPEPEDDDPPFEPDGEPDDEPTTRSSRRSGIKRRGREEADDEPRSPTRTGRSRRQRR